MPDQRKPGCSAYNCAWRIRVQGRMVTNSSCRCFEDLFWGIQHFDAMLVAERAVVRNQWRAVRARVAEMRDEIDTLKARVAELEGGAQDA